MSRLNDISDSLFDRICELEKKRTHLESIAGEVLKEDAAAIRFYNDYYNFLVEELIFLKRV